MGLNHEDTKTRSKYQPYPSYKTSRVEWLSELPSAWGLVRVKNESTLKARIGWQNLRTEEFIDEGPFCVTGTDFKNGSINWVTAYHVSEKRYVLDKNIQLQDGDLLITKDGTIGKLAIVDNLKDGQATLNSGVFILRPNKRVLKTKFMYWVMSSSIFSNFVKYVSNGSTINHLYQADFYNMYFGLPSLNEQQSISNFLDQETGKMDLLIEKQQTMIALLKEKRQAFISHAVTKGIPNQNSPNTKMKDSGIKLLGQIPEDWGVIPLRHLGFLQNGISKGGDYFGSGFPFLNYGDVYKNDVLPTNVSGLANSNEYDQLLYSVKRGDIFFTRTSETVDEIGIASTCLKTIDKAIFSGFTIRFRPSGNSILPEFSRYYFRSGISTIFFVKEMNLVTRASLGQDLLKRLPVIIPPIKEQSKIVLYLDDKTKKIDTLIEKSQQAIALLKERKTALISAAVTGKIDVRGAV